MRAREIVLALLLSSCWWLWPRVAAAEEGEIEPGRSWVSISAFSRPSPVLGARDTGGLFAIGVPLERVTHLFDTAPVRIAERPLPLPLTTELARRAVLAAWRSAGLGADDRRLDDLASRAHWSALLPELRLRAIRWDQERLYAYGTDERLSDSTGANLGLEARLTWHLDRLVYAGDEPGLERIRLDRQDARARVASRVLEALFHWQRALADLRGAPAGTREELEASEKVAEGEAALDVLTGGWFSSRSARP